MIQQKAQILIIALFLVVIDFNVCSAQGLVTDSNLLKEKFKEHFYKGADSYISVSAGLTIPRKEWGDASFTGADYGVAGRLDVALMFAEYFGIGFQIPYVYSGNNKSAHNFDPAYKDYTSDGWRGGGFLFGAALSVPIYPVYVDMKFYPGYQKMHLPNTEAILRENGVDNVLTQESVSKGGFAFSLSGGIRYPIKEKLHLGLYAGKTNVRFKFKEVPLKTNGELIEKVEITHTMDIAEVGFRLVKTFGKNKNKEK